MIFLNLPATLYWIVLLALSAGCLVFAVLSLNKRSLSYVAAGLLVVALIVAALRFQPAPHVIGILLSLLAIAIAVAGGGPAVNLALGLAGGGSPAGDHGGILVRADRLPTGDVPVGDLPAGDQPSPPQGKHEVLRGGATIGILERLAVAGAVVAGHPEAIAVVVAVKGVGRFTELDASEARERFIIGTMVSLIWACAAAALAWVALH